MSSEIIRRRSDADILDTEYQFETIWGRCIPTIRKAALLLWTERSVLFKVCVTLGLYVISGLLLLCVDACTGFAMFKAALCEPKEMAQRLGAFCERSIFNRDVRRLGLGIALGADLHGFCEYDIRTLIQFRTPLAHDTLSIILPGANSEVISGNPLASYAEYLTILESTLSIASSPLTLLNLEMHQPDLVALKLVLQQSIDPLQYFRETHQSAFKLALQLKNYRAAFLMGQAGIKLHGQYGKDSCLKIAIGLREFKIAAYLLSIGADINCLSTVRDSKYLPMALQFADNDIHALDFVLSKGVKVNLTTKLLFRYTSPLLSFVYAALAGRFVDVRADVTQAYIYGVYDKLCQAWQRDFADPQILDTQSLDEEFARIARALKIDENTLRNNTWLDARLDEHCRPYYVEGAAETNQKMSALLFSTCDLLMEGLTRGTQTHNTGESKRVIRKIKS